MTTQVYFSSVDVWHHKPKFEQVALACIKQKVNLCIYGASAEMEHYISSHKKLASALQQGYITLVAETPKEDAILWNLTYTEIHQLPFLLQCVQEQKTVYAVEQPRVHLKSILLWFVLFIQKICSPLPMYKIKGRVVGIYENDAEKSVLESVYLAILYGLPIEYISLNEPIEKEKSNLVYVLTVLKLAWVMRWRWFVTTPLLQLMQRPRSLFAHGNSAGYRLIFICIIFCCMVFMPYLSKDYGISWDEKIQHDYGKEIIRYYASGKRDTTLFDQTKHLYNTMLFYGCSFDVLTGYFHSRFIPETDVYAFRHQVNALYGVVALIFIGLIGRWIGTWRTALLSVLFGLLTPSFFGHSMNNPKDIPFATAYVFSLYYLLRFCSQLPKPRLSSIVYLGLGIGWAISIRAGGLVLIPYTLLFVGLVWLYNQSRQKFKSFWSNTRSIAVAVALSVTLGYFSGLIIWPYGQRAPFENPWKALKSLSKVNYLHTYENFSGKRIYMSEVPWNYVPEWIAIGSPLFIHVGIFLLIVALFFWRHRKQTYVYVGALLFLFVFPIFLVIIQNSMLYNGWRHFIFVYFSIVWLAALGWEYSIQFVKFVWSKWVLAILLILLLANVGVWMIRNHPNQYIYINELLGGVKGSYGDYELDYYSNTVKQAVEWLLENEDVRHRKIKLCTNNELLTVSHITDKKADSIQVLWTRDYERYKQDWDYAIFTSRTYSPTQMKRGYYPPKGTIHTIDVDGVPVCAIVKRVSYDASKAYTHIKNQDFFNALSLFLAEHNRDSTEEEYTKMIAMCYLNIGKPDEANIFIDKTLRLHPEGFMAHYLKGFYYLSQNNLDMAQLEFEQSIKNRINNGDAHAEVGHIYFEKGLFRQAIEKYETAIGFMNNNPLTYLNLAISKFNLGDNQKALYYIELCINRHPTYLPAYEKAIEMLGMMGDLESQQYVLQEMVRVKEMYGL